MYARSQAATGSVQYAPDKSAFVWKIKQLGGGREFLMRAHFGLPSVRNGASSVLRIDSVGSLRLHIPAEENEKRPPITVKFEIPYFTVSGIQVRYLKIVEKSGYQALPWVRYVIHMAAWPGLTSEAHYFAGISRNTATITGELLSAKCIGINRMLTTKITLSLRTALEKGSAPIVPM